MIGTTLSLSLPAASDSMATAIAKTATCLSQLNTSIGDKATTAALNISAQLDMGGNWLANAGAVLFAAGNVPTAAGSMYYSGGSFYAVDGIGAIKLTANGAINTAAIGGIGGDYGGVNPALVSYNQASSVYRFYVNPGTTSWADVAVRNLILNANNHTATVQAPGTLASNLAFTLPTALPANPTPVTLDSSGNLATSAVYLGRQVFPPNSTPYTPTAGTRRILVRMVGGGGGGGGAAACSSLGSYAVAGGGSGGVYFEKWFTGGITGGTVSVGAAGTAGSSAGGNGGDGGDTTIVINGTTYTAKGGKGGTGATSVATGTAKNAGGGLNAGSSVGDVVFQEIATDGLGTNTQGTNGVSSLLLGGKGGGTPFGRPAASGDSYTGATSYSIAGAAGSGSGVGGSGTVVADFGATAAAQAGGAGTAGLIIINEYI